MAEDLPPETKSLEEQAAERARAMHVENLAFATGSQDPAFMDALTKRKAIETEAEASARRQAAEHIHQLRQRNQVAEFSQHPWGLDYLKLDASPQAIHDRVSEEVGQEEKEDEELEAQREEALEKEMKDARQHTIDVSQIVARKLKEHDVTPDTVVGVEHVSEVKKFTREGLRLQGKLRTNIPEVRREEENYGSPHAWKLPISGQIDDHATVLLNEDGSILTAYGKFEEGTTDEEPSRLSIKPNRALKKEKPGRLPLINQPEPATVPQHTYISRIDERLESDIGMANLPVNTPIAKAHIVLSREQAMQEAVVSLLVKHGIPIDNEAATKLLEEPAPNKPHSDSEEDKQAG